MALRSLLLAGTIIFAGGAMFSPPSALAQDGQVLSEVVAQLELRPARVNIRKTGTIRLTTRTDSEAGQLAESVSFEVSTQNGDGAWTIIGKEGGRIRRGKDETGKLRRVSKKTQQIIKSVVQYVDPVTGAEAATVLDLVLPAGEEPVVVELPIPGVTISASRNENGRLLMTLDGEDAVLDAAFFAPDRTAGVSVDDGPVEPFTLRQDWIADLDTLPGDTFDGIDFRITTTAYDGDGRILDRETSTIFRTGETPTVLDQVHLREDRQGRLRGTLTVLGPPSGTAPAELSIGSAETGDILIDGSNQEASENIFLYNLPLDIVPSDANPTEVSPNWIVRITAISETGKLVDTFETSITPNAIVTLDRGAFTYDLQAVPKGRFGAEPIDGFEPPFLSSELDVPQLNAAIVMDNLPGVFLVVPSRLDVEILAEDGQFEASATNEALSSQTNYFFVADAETADRVRSSTLSARVEIATSDATTDLYENLTLTKIPDIILRDTTANKIKIKKPWPPARNGVPRRRKRSRAPR